MKRIILPLIAFLCCLYVNGQQAFTNNGNLQIFTGASLAGFGNFTNTASGVLVNNGSFYVKGSITNDQPAMANGAGTLFLDGSVAQSVNGTQNFNTFNLVTNNTAGFTLNNNLAVYNVHTFTSGMIVTSATPNYLVYEAGSSYTGDGDSRHVNGWVKKIGNTNFIFPVGNGTYERTAAIESLSAVSEFNAHHRMPTISPNSFLSPIFQVDAYEYWDIDRVSGGTALVHLNWNKSKVYFPTFMLNEIQVGYFTGGFWTVQGGSATGNVFTTGDVTSNAQNAFGSFTFVSTSWTLPLHFLSLTAERKQGSTLVQWKTAQEYNVDHFDVERSDNAVAFSKIGSLPARNTTTENQYEYTDVLPLQGTAWYRIRSIDKDGKENLSAIVSVSESNGNHSLYVVNNPVHGNIYLSASAAYKGIYRYSLYSVAGQLMQAGQVRVEAGVVTIPVAKGVIPGMYTFDLQNGIHRLTKKIVVQ